MAMAPSLLLLRLASSRFTKPRYLLSFSFSTTSPPTPKPPPIRVGLTDSVGRAVFATRSIPAGDLIHTAEPAVCHPSPSVLNPVCYSCLARLPNLSSVSPFCSHRCHQRSKEYYDVEMKANWMDFDNYCRNHGLKYPLLVKRLACMIISGAARSDSLDILQPANLTPEMILKMEEEFALLRNAFTKAFIADEHIAFLTKQWYINALARIRINAFRIQLAGGGGLYEDLLSLAVASVEAEDAVGNAVYILSSFYNHDCDPNTHIIWIDNANAKLKALRDIDEGEELRICYIDASLDRDARQELLLGGFGFQCNCSRCLHVMARTRRTAYVVRELPADQPDEGVADQGDEDIDETVAQAGRVRPTASARRQRGAGKDISQMMGYRHEEGPSEEAVEEGHAVEEDPHVQAQAQAHVEEGPHVQAQAPVGFPGGPVDTAVLASYGGHVASILWDGSRDREDLKMVNHGQLVLDFDVDPFVRDYVVAAGLGQLRVTAQPKIDKGIQIAFLERWHQETSSFHLPVGEMSITLDDVDQLLHIPVSGALFAGRELTRQWKRNEAVQLCVDLLGVTAQEINAEFSINRGNNIRFEFLKTRVYPQRLADGNYVMAARAYMLYLVGTTLFASKAGTLVRAWYLCLFRDMDIIGQWSWGAMALAHLYRELTESTRIETKQLAGYSSLLQSWIHEHFQGVSFGGRQPNPRYVEGLPRACRWTFSPASGNVVEYRHILDRMTDMDVTWDPYSSHRVKFPL